MRSAHRNALSISRAATRHFLAARAPRRGVSSGLSTTFGLPAGQSTGCVIKPAARCLINESDEWHASDYDDDDDDPALEIEASREESYDLDV